MFLYVFEIQKHMDLLEKVVIFAVLIIAVVGMVFVFKADVGLAGYKAISKEVSSKISPKESPSSAERQPNIGKNYQLPKKAQDTLSGTQQSIDNGKVADVSDFDLKCSVICKCKLEASYSPGCVSTKDGSVLFGSSGGKCSKVTYVDLPVISEPPCDPYKVCKSACQTADLVAETPSVDECRLQSAVSCGSRGGTINLGTLSVEATSLGPK